MIKLELLSKSHARDEFDCGSDPLNGFLKQIARQHAERGISRTYVLIAEEEPASRKIAGYFSINLCQIESKILSADEAKKLPHTVAAVRLGRLAIDKNHQRQGIGRLLLIGAMRKFMQIFECAGGIGIFVDAKDQQAKLYYEKAGFVPLRGNELELFLPVRSIQKTLGWPAPTPPPT